MAVDDFIMTIESDDEGGAPAAKSSNTARSSKGEDVQLDPEFTFDFSGDPYSDLTGGLGDVDDLVKKGSKPVCVSLHNGELHLLSWIAGPHIRR